MVFLEDVRKRSPASTRCAASSKAGFARAVHKRARVQPDDAAVVLFTSGSEGKPKGVVLSNANLVANAYQVKAHAGDVLTTEDVFFNPLPIFHSFGLTAGLLTSLLNGIKVVLYPSPLHYRQIPKLIAGNEIHDPARHRHLSAGLCPRCRSGRSCDAFATSSPGRSG